MNASFPSLMGIFLLSALAVAPALAQAGAWSGTQDATSDSQTVQATALRAEALAAPNLSQAQLAWLKPTRRQLPANHRAQTDFTAYTLEWGESKIGLVGMSVGVLPRTQLGTVPSLFALRIPNANLKVNALRAGPLDVALQGQHYRLQMGEFIGTYTGIGGVTSLKIVGPWSIHVGGHYALMGAHGLPDLSQLSPLISSWTGAELDAWSAEQVAEHVTIDLQARNITARVATDIRFNRRDSIVLQGQAMVWGDLDNAIEAPPILDLDETLSIAEGGDAPIANTYVVSAAWQVAWKQLELRLGVGTSSIPGAWLLQSTELSYRFGGTTRRTEARMRRTWRRNRRTTGDDQA